MSKLPTDPAVIGPGIWYTIHMIARYAHTDIQKKNFLEFMNLLRDNFPCEKCRTHISKYIEENPIEQVLNVINENGEPIGAFKWSWMFHNAVNLRINNRSVDFETAYNMYNISGVMLCNRGCDEIPKQANPPTGLSLVRAVNESIYFKGSNPFLNTKNRFSIPPETNSVYKRPEANLGFSVDTNLYTKPEIKKETNYTKTNFKLYEP